MLFSSTYKSTSSSFQCSGMHVWYQELNIRYVVRGTSSRNVVNEYDITSTRVRLTHFYTQWATLKLFYMYKYKYKFIISYHPIVLPLAWKGNILNFMQTNSNSCKYYFFNAFYPAPQVWERMNLKIIFFLK